MGNIFEKLKSLFAGKKMEICIVGLENSGKTTLSNKLSLTKNLNTGPTIGLDIKTFKKGNITLNMWDLGGQVQYRSEWSKYAIGTDAIIFVVDSSDRERIPTAKFELHRMLDDNNLRDIPVLVVGNKIDLEGLREKEIVEEMNLEYLERNEWILIMASALKGIHIAEVLDWLINKSKK